MPLTRRQFLYATASTCLSANPLGLPIGLQLWTVREQLRESFNATLLRVAEIGYREVELFELPIANPHYRKKNFSERRPDLRSGHFYLDEFQNPRIIEAAHELGLRYMIVVFPTLRSLRTREVSKMKFEDLVPLYDKITLDDYKWNADQFNSLGEKLHQGRTPTRLSQSRRRPETLRKRDRARHLNRIHRPSPGHLRNGLRTRHSRRPRSHRIPEKVSTRIELLHLKDLKPGFETSTTLDTEEKGTNTEIGAGGIDWNKLFAQPNRPAT